MKHTVAIAPGFDTDKTTWPPAPGRASNRSYARYTPCGQQETAGQRAPHFVFVSNFTRLQAGSPNHVQDNPDDFVCDGWIVNISGLRDEDIPALTIDELLARPKQRVTFTPRGASRLACGFRPLKIEAKPNRWGHELGIDDAKLVSFCELEREPPDETHLPEEARFYPAGRTYQTVAEFALYRFYEELFPEALALRTRLFSVTYIDAPIRFGPSRGSQTPGCSQDVLDQTLSTRMLAQRMPNFTIETRSSLARRASTAASDKEYTAIDGGSNQVERLQYLFEDEQRGDITEYDEISTARFQLYRKLIGDNDYRLFSYYAELSHNNYRYHDEDGRIHPVPYDLNAADLVRQRQAWNHELRVGQALVYASADNTVVQNRHDNIDNFPSHASWNDDDWEQGATHTLDRLCDEEATERAMATILASAAGYESELEILFDGLRERLDVLRSKWRS